MNLSTNKRIQSFFAFLSIQLRMLIFRWRWLIPIPAFLFIGYLVTNALKWQLLPSFLIQPGDAPAVNSWDGFFIAFGNPYYMVFVIANIFLLLVCDSLPEPSYGQYAVFRLGTRNYWWVAKSLSVFLAAALYVAGGMLLVFAVLNIGLPFHSDWSKFGSYPANINLPFFVVDQSSPLAIALTLGALQTLGFWVMGMFIQVITLITRRYLLGYMAALASLVGGMALSGSLINVSDFWKLLPPLRNLILIFHPFPFREVPISWSFIYWASGSVVLFMLGYWFSRRQSYLAKR